MSYNRFLFSPTLRMIINKTHPYSRQEVKITACKELTVKAKSVYALCLSLLLSLSFVLVPVRNKKMKVRSNPLLPPKFWSSC